MPMHPQSVAKTQQKSHPHAAMRGGFDLDQRPFIVFWEITRACALACRHCRAEAQTHAHPDELDTVQAKKLVDDLARMAPPLLVITGGDPMMRRDILEIISYAKHKGLTVGFSPAATARLVNSDFFALKAAGVHRMSLSLDGACEATHDEFRGVKHTFARTLEAARLANEAGIPLQVNTTITKDTIAEFDRFAELVASMKPAMWSVFLLVPTGRAALDQMPTAVQVEEVLDKLETLSHQVGFDIKTTEAHHYRRVGLQQAKKRGTPPRRPALATRDGKGVMFISHIGEIQPSGFLPLTAGNVKQHDVAEIYRHAELFVQLRNDDLLRGKCGYCEYRSLCGGSRSRAYGISGDYFAADPLCVYQPPGWLKAKQGTAQG